MTAFARHAADMTEVAGSTETSMPTAPAGDPRGGLLAALELAGTTIARVRPEQYDARTPCPEYDVRTLASHMVAILRRVAVIGRGGSPFETPNIADDVAAGAWKQVWDGAAADVTEIWSSPAVLSTPMQLPFGTLPGAVASVVYTTEFTLHTWDLAQATGQKPSFDPGVLATSLASMQRAVPAQPRGNPVPFGQVVDVDPDASDIDRLVAWYGRTP